MIRRVRSDGDVTQRRREKTSISVNSAPLRDSTEKLRVSVANYSVDETETVRCQSPTASESTIRAQVHLRGNRCLPRTVPRVTVGSCIVVSIQFAVVCRARCPPGVDRRRLRPAASSDSGANGHQCGGAFLVPKAEGWARLAGAWPQV